MKTDQQRWENWSLNIPFTGLIKPERKRGHILLSLKYQYFEAQYSVSFVQESYQEFSVYWLMYFQRAQILSGWSLLQQNCMWASIHYHYLGTEMDAGMTVSATPNPPLPNFG